VCRVPAAPRPHPGTRRPAPRGVVSGALAAAALAGCAPPPVTVAPAPSASDPVCAEVLLRAPEELAGAPRRTTTSQASRAWGDPPIVLRCGVEPPGPSPERCVAIDAGPGLAVDWLALESEDAWTFVTYGRVPAVEVVVPKAALAPAAQPTAPLVDLAPAVAATTAERGCL
jgi:hypothetical protein